MLDQNRLKLIKGDEALKKVILPRFPFCYLTFRSDDNNDGLTFEVKDISHTGMQISLKDGAHSFKKEALKGQLHWKGRKLKIEGDLVWKTSTRAGVKFNENIQGRLGQFLNVKELAAFLKPIHSLPMDLDLPQNLKYWLRADGPLELFIWRHNDGEIAKFEVIVFENYVQWIDGQGVETGRVLTKRDIDTPLMAEDEFLYRADGDADNVKLELATTLILSIEPDHLSPELIEFLQLKLEP